MNGVQVSRRRQYIVDRPFQLSITYLALTIMAVATVIGFGCLVILPEAEQIEGLSGSTLRTLIIGVSVGHFLLAAGSCGIAAILITHRVAGPARVLRTAVEALRDGRTDSRTTLRKKDYLHDLAGSIHALQQDTVSQQAAQTRFLAELDDLLEGGNLDGALQLVRERVPSAAEAQPEPVDAPQV